MARPSPGALAALPRYQPSVVDMLRATALAGPSLPALNCDGVRLDYGAYLASIEAFADELGKRAQGTVIAVALRNSIELAVVSFAVHAAGAVLCLLNPDYTPHELSAILADAAPERVIGNRAFLDKVKAADLPHLVLHEVTEGGGAVIAASGAGSSRSKDIHPDMLATIQYTGGTSGRPKGVELTHGAIAANVAQREAMLPTRFGCERILGVMPMFHSFGTAMCLHLAAACGGELVILPAYRPALVLEAVKAHAITLFPAGPTVYSSLLAFPEITPAAMSSIVASYSGSAALAPDVLRRWEQLTGSPIFEGYGQTEAGPVLTYHSPLFEQRPGSVGKPLPLTSIRIVADDGADCRAGEVGEIWASGPQLMRGYRHLPVETAAALSDGWLRTGDLGHVDSDGYLYIDGRKKEMAIVKGYNVYPIEIDHLLSGHPDIFEAGTVAVPDAYSGEALYSFVSLGQDAQVTAANLEQWCGDRLVRYKMPTAITLLGELPKTSVGKIDKIQLKRLAEAIHRDAPVARRA